jgi:hypothetical protein
MFNPPHAPSQEGIHSFNHALVLDIYLLCFKNIALFILSLTAMEWGLSKKAAAQCATAI